MAMTQRYMTTSTKYKFVALTITCNYRSGMIEHDQKQIMLALDLFKQNKNYELGDYFYELSNDTNLLHIHGTICSTNNRVPYIKGMKFAKGINVNVKELEGAFDIQRWERYIRKSSNQNIIENYDSYNTCL